MITCSFSSNLVAVTDAESGAIRLHALFFLSGSSGLRLHADFGQEYLDLVKSTWSSVPVSGSVPTQTYLVLRRI